MTEKITSEEFMAKAKAYWDKSLEEHEAERKESLDKWNEILEECRRIFGKDTSTKKPDAEPTTNKVVPEMKSADEMKTLINNMENVERNKFLEYLFNAHFDSRFTDDYDLATKYQIEDTLDRDLTEDELLVMKIAYGNGYFRGGKDGMDKVLRGYAEK